MISERSIVQTAPSGAAAHSFTSKTGFSFGGHVEIVGNGPNFSFSNPASITDQGQRGIALEECGDYDLIGWRVRNIAGTAFEFKRLPSTPGDYWNHAGKLIGLTARHCHRGYWLHDYAEYETLIGCHAHDCAFGFFIESGNEALIGCNASQCYTAFKLYGGGNNGHGVMEGCFSNHSVYGIHAENVSLGYAINGFQAGGGYPGGTQMTLAHINSQGIVYNGGYFASVDVAVDATSSVHMHGVLLRGEINLTRASGGVLKVRNCVPFSNFSGTYNGNTWNGEDIG